MAEPRVVVEELFRRERAGDGNVLDELVAENFINHAAGPQGREGLRQILDTVRHDLGDEEPSTTISSPRAISSCIT